MVRHPFPNFQQIKHIFEDADVCKNYLLDNGVFDLAQPCPSCGDVIQLNTTTLQYRCNKRQCNKKWSAMNGTLFSKLKLPINQIMHVLHVWLCGAS